MSEIQVTEVDPRGTIPTTLIAELSAELAPLYPNHLGGGGTAAFKVDDVLVPRAVFVVAWRDDEALGCGALRPLADPEIGEIKRMYVRPTARGLGISRLILSALENLARGFGYRLLRLETGTLQTEALGLYGSSSYQRIDCYGIYAHEPLSVCFEKPLDPLD